MPSKARERAPPRPEVRRTEVATLHNPGLGIIHGYGKRLVMNVAVLTELDQVRAKLSRLWDRIGKQESAVMSARDALTKAKLRLNAAKARRARQDDLLDDTLLARHPRKDDVRGRIAGTRAERDRYEQVEQAVHEAQDALAKAGTKLAALEAQVPVKEAEIEILESRKEIYQADTELDQIATAFKLGFVMICEHLVRLFFPGLGISLHGLMRQILSLPGRRVIQGAFEHVYIKASPNSAIMRAVEEACERVNALGVVRDGRTVRLSVERIQDARMRGAKAGR